MGDWRGFLDKIQEVVPIDQQQEHLQKLVEGKFTLRIMYEQFHNIIKGAPLGQVGSSFAMCCKIPGLESLGFILFWMNRIYTGYVDATWISSRDDAAGSRARKPEENQALHDDNGFDDKTR